MRFHEIAPSQFENLFQFLPFLDYTRTVLTNDYDKGRLNILNFMSGFAGAPDPGPKAYLCCGLCDAPELSSTPLHLDVSNAVNFLPIVQAPIDMSYEEISEGIIRAQLL
ncbi:unnamed protein product [Anisakis simplex]|uniref:Lysine-specific demethylase hairless (inferred by orthology to a human protein) n=1 Tax=Anisakis simplex TaxID=6269 RepID=A0A0M3JF92_ANISI|nr:unnamed protein product [Anisakis simplex]